MKKILRLVLLFVCFAVCVCNTAFSQMLPKDNGKVYQNGKYLKKTTVPSGSAVIPIVKTGGTEWEGLTIDTLYSQTQEIATGSALPSAKAAKVGNKYLYVTSVDTTEMTFLGGNKWRSDIIKGSSTPAVSVVNNGQTIDNSNAIWKNPNISIFNNRSTDYTLQNGEWKPLKGYIDVTDAGAIGDGITDNTAAYTKIMSILTNGGIMYFPKGNFKGIIYLNGKVSVKGDGESSVITSLTDSSAIVISGFSVIDNGSIKISDVRIDGHNGIEFRYYFAGRVQGENINMHVSNIGIWKREGNIYNTWKNCQFNAGNYGVYAVNSPTEIMHAGAETFFRCRLTGATKAGYFLNDTQDGAGQIVFQDCYLEGNSGFGVFVKNFGAGRNILPIVFENTWNEANGTLDSATINGIKYKVSNYYFNNAKMVTIKGSYVGSLEAKSSSILIDNCFIDNSIVVDSNSYITGHDCNLNGVNSNMDMDNISGFYPQFANSFRLKGVQNIIKKSKNVVVSYNYADSPLISGATKSYEKYLFDSCQSKSISGFTLLSPLWTKTANKYYVVTLAVKNLSSAEFINFAYDVALTQFFTHDTLWHTYVGIGYSQNGSGGTIGCGANGTGIVYTSALQYLEFDTYSEALQYANAKCYADNNSTKVELWAASGTTIIPKLQSVTIGSTSNPSGHLLNVQGDAYFNSTFTTYTNDGVFGTTVKPIIINNYNGQTRIGYYSGGDGQYYGRIGHVTGSNKVSYGAIAANEFSINTGTSNTERVKVNNTGVGINTSTPQYKLDIDAKTGGLGNPIRAKGLINATSVDSIIGIRTVNEGIFERISPQSIVNKVFSDSCLSGITANRSLGIGISETQTVSFGKTITSPQVHLTLKSDTVGSQSLMLATSNSTQFQYGMSNGTGGTVNYQVIYRVCPAGGVGY